ncbi:MAG: hypothetical protein E6J75_16790 [Deltaproteobacteria bacterium]|nr:MAG: hypothetical protein E6J75_16790 [Deltaproteobacteria bacterium]
MKPALLHLLLAGVTLAGLALSTRLAARPFVRVELPQWESGERDVPAGAPVPTSESSSVAMVARDPFRITKRAAPMAYDPLRVGQPPAPAARPTLVLDGIVGDLRVKDIRWDRVVIGGPDTLWTLTVKEPWK